MERSNRMNTKTQDVLQQNFTTALQHHNAGNLVEAERLYRSILLLSPAHPHALHLLGVVYMQKGIPAQAIELIEKALPALGKDAGAHNNYGLALLALSRLNEAEAAFRKATKLDFRFSDAYNNLAHMKNLEGNLLEARKFSQKALEANPNKAEALWNLAECEMRLKMTQSAIDGYRKYTRLRPNDSNAYLKLGSALFAMNQTDQAIQVLQQGLAVDPGNVPIATTAAGIFVSFNMPEVASALLDSAMSCHPEGSPQRFALSFARLFMPVVNESCESIVLWRTRYLETLQQLSLQTSSLPAPPALTPSSFYLAYHEIPDGDLMRLQSQVLRSKVPSLNYVNTQLSSWEYPSEAGRRIRIGFLSEFFSGHTICKLTQGFIRNLDRSKFDVCVIHTAGSKYDHARSVMDSLADTALELPVDHTAALNQLTNLKLDVLFYPDIGMSSTSYYLAHARIAPIQVVTWGHPDTTGINTLDYFVSAKHLETTVSLVDYSESVVLLSRLPCYYEPFSAPSLVPARSAYGLPEDATLYCCPQTLQKLHPDFDRILAEILEQDPKGVLVVIEGQPKEWVQQIRLRWQKVSPALGERVIVLPSQPLDRFMGLLAHTDVLLDPIYFGSGNTLYEAMVYGTPIVTCPGKFARGRIVAAAYQQMGINPPEAPVASDAKDYARIAVSLGTDSERRLALRRKLQLAAAEHLYADTQAVRELETFFTESLIAKARGGKLPENWSPLQQMEKLH